MGGSTNMNAACESRMFASFGTSATAYVQNFNWSGPNIQDIVNGGDVPTPTPTPPPTATNTPVTPTPTVPPTDTHTPTVPPTDTHTPTVPPTDTYTPTVPPTATASPTPIPPTDTPTATTTPIPPTATFTETPTPVPPTATFTSTPSYTSTHTTTPVPPTATFTSTPSYTSTHTATPIPPTYTSTFTPSPTNRPPSIDSVLISPLVGYKSTVFSASEVNPFDPDDNYFRTKKGWQKQEGSNWVDIYGATDQSSIDGVFFDKHDWLRGAGTPIDFDGAQGQPKYSPAVEIKNSSPELVSLALEQSSSRSVRVRSVYFDADNDNAIIDPNSVQWLYSEDGQNFNPIPCGNNPLELILDQNGIYMVSAQSKDTEGAMSDRKEATLNTANINTAVKKEQWELYK